MKLESTADNKNINEYKTEIDAIQAIDSGKTFKHWYITFDLLKANKGHLKCLYNYFQHNELNPLLYGR